MNQLLTIAHKEFNDGLRNRWFISITVIFAILSIGLTSFGAAVSGETGVASIETTIASLASLAVFLIPLIALLVSYDSFVGEQESGTLLLLLTYPMSKTQLVLGKFVGQGSIIALATLLGFGSSAILLYFKLDSDTIFSTFAIFILTAILLGLSFTAIAYIASLLVNEKSKAAGLALIIWFFFALVFDLAVLALLVSVKEGISESLLSQILMFNPADIFRLINLANLSLDNANGVLAVAMNNSLSLTQLFALLGLWVIAPLGIAIALFSRKTL